MARERRWGVAAGLAVAVVVVLAALGAAATYSPLFEVSKIRVVGSSRPDAQIIAAAGLAEATNVFHLDTGAAERALLDDPWIRGARVHRQLPSTIVIQVDERVPVVTADGAAAADDGIILPGAPTIDLPVVRSDTGELSAEAIRWAAAAAGSLDADTRARVEFIVISNLDGSLSLRLGDGPIVRWGSVGGEREKAAALMALLDLHDAGRTMTSIDVSVPASPSARFAG